jgi:hypothetical protein
MARLARLALVVLLASCAGCSDDANTPDGRVDAAVFDAMPDGPSGCEGTGEFTGELIDFDSSPANFMGVFDAVFSRPGRPECTVHTAPNGRFILVIVDAPFVFDVDAPDDYFDGIWPVEGARVPGVTFSARAFSASDLGNLGVTPDPTKAHVMLYQDNPPVALTVSGNPGATFTTADGSVWAAGNAEAYILFANVEVGTGTVTLTDATGTVEPTALEIPVQAGKVTYITTREQL